MDRRGKGVKSILRMLYMEVPIHLFTCFMLVEGRLGVNVVASGLRLKLASVGIVEEKSFLQKFLFI